MPTKKSNKDQIINKTSLSLSQEKEYKKKISESDHKYEILVNENKHLQKDIQRLENMNRQLENVNSHLDCALKNSHKKK